MPKSITIFIIIFLVLPPSVFGWERKVYNYERNVYQGGYQNWGIDQSDKGWIYFANSSGLLEFDGVNWALYSARNKLIRTVRTAGERIYVGGSSEFGYFEPDKRGELAYHSVLSHSDNWGGEVWNIFLAGDKVYFLDDRNIFIYTEGHGVKSVPSPVKIDCSAFINGTIYIGSSEGVFYLNEQRSLMPLKSASKLTNMKIVSILSYRNQMLVVTARSGIYSLQKNECNKVDFIDQAFLTDNQLFCASVIDNKIALGSVQNGIFVIDLKYPIPMEHFNLDNGLKNNTVLSCFFDNDKNLWLGLDKGVSYIDLKSSIQPLFAKDSPIGTGYCSAVYHGDLYLGTNQGLYKQDKNGCNKLIENSEGQIWSLSEHDNSLFCAGDNHILVISPHQTYQIGVRGVWTVSDIAGTKDKLIAGLYAGLALLEKKNGKWQFSHTIANSDNYSGRGFIEDDVRNEFWIADSGKDISKIILDKDFSRIISSKKYRIDGAQMQGNIFFRRIDNVIVACMQNGIYQYNRISDSFIRYPQLESILDGQKYYEYLSIDKMNNIWFVSDKNLKLLLYTNQGYSKTILNLGLNNELVENYQDVNLIDSVAIIAVDNAFAKASIHNLELSNKLKLFVRKLTVNLGDSMINYGVDSNPIVLPYSQNSIQIHFSAANYSHSSNILYTYRLKGVDDKWSIPSTQTLKEYTNLPEGDYTFEVKAFIKGSNESANTAIILFKVLPPWYRSVWAYIIYMLLIVTAFYILYKKTVSKQKKIVQQKKEELRLQNLLYEEERRQKDNEIYVLQNQNLKTELHYKSQELTGYILNVIKKNEALEDVKRSAMGISKAIDEQRPVTTIRQKVVRLISHINRSIEQDADFKVFESNFNLIHGDFLKLLGEKYPQLTRNDKILCAYLKMNFSSKEIAPLLNISVRGVEVGRYRLRKKMNLDRDINLTEFMQGL